MRKFLLASVLTVASSMVASATLVIDDFTTTLQDGVCAPNNPSCGYTSGGPTQFSGTATLDNNGRVIQVTGTNTPTDTGANAKARIAPPGVLSFSSDTPTTGGLWLTWSTDAPLNLLTSGEQFIQFNIVSSDLGGMWRITLYDGVDGAGNATGTGLGTTFKAFGAASNLSQIAAWSDFTVGGGSLTNVRAIVFEYQGEKNADTSFDNFAFNTPEPSTWVLLGSALVGLAVYRRRK